jgi:hypothetical protein
VLKWNTANSQFTVLWKRDTNLEHRNGEADQRITLAAGDRSYSGRFLPDRDGILHRARNFLAVLTWRDGAMKVWQRIDSWLGGAWNLGTNDKLVIGDFHNNGPDVGDPTRDFVGDGIADVFIHNGWGTGMVGVQFLQLGTDTVEQIGLTWINHREILFDT